MTDKELHELIGRNYSSVLRVCRSWLTREDAEDAAQEVFTRYLASPRCFESPESERAWFIRCAKNQAVNRLRALKRERSRLLPLPEENEPPSLTHFPEEGELDSLIASLPPYTQMVLRLHYGEGYPYKELARQLRTTEGRLKMLVSRAKNRIFNMKGDNNG